MSCEPREDDTRLYKLMVNASKDYITLLDRDYVYCEVNDAYLQARGLAHSEIVGMPAADLWGREVFDGYIKDKIDRSFAGEIVSDSSVFEFAKGEVNYMDVTYYPCRDDNGEITHTVVVSHNITTLKKSEEKVRHLAYHDSLTHLPNRLQFMELLTVEISRAERDQSKLAVLFLDLDKFKNINDSLGHHVGDKLLMQVAERLRDKLRLTDTIARISERIQGNGTNLARLGGDEFTLIIPDLKANEDVAIVARKIIDAFSQSFFVDGHELHISTSIGISIFPTDGTDLETLLRCADMAMYKAKDRGRNDYHFYSPAINTAVLKKLKIESQLIGALKNRELISYYQPKIRIADGKIVGVEALARWLSPELGVVFPNEFIPIAEESQLIKQVDFAILESACRQVKEWHQSSDPELTLAVNISACHLGDDGFVDRLLELLDSTDFPAAKLHDGSDGNTLVQNPEPSTVILLGSGIMGLAALRWKKKQTTEEK